MKSPEEQLEEIQQAISDILLNAQEASYNGQRVRKADLEALYKREAQLIRQVSRKKKGGGIRIRLGSPV